MVDRCLMHPFIQSEIRNPMDVVSKAGWAPLPAGYQRMIAEFPEKQAYAIDKKLWDWTMPGWVVLEYVLAKLRQCREHSLLWEWMVWRRIYYSFGPGAVLAEPTGAIWRQTFWGLMKSGSLLTLSMNGASQYLEHALAWLRMLDGGPISWPPRMWAMGDDTLARMNSEWVDGYLRELAKTGCIVKLAENSREFSGFRVEGDSVANAIVTPIYPEKHKFLVKHVRAEDEHSVFLSFSLLYALARPGWLNNVIGRTDVTVGPMQRLWAKGMAKLELFDTLPEWTRFWD
ncbi:hypothetical protein 2 [Hubei sobemo-like virus 7]|uniref:hypothetical protein 2 n=1 Tax=Hubei sobemo-like virus 7 TaxID=1923240 RepID=UPI00090B5987|nr:hypothetical protein 2 [Hubei sobemo-like virus 7]APG75850.1 hypothetical protein 2 [Hubei sobemo-like virus 7]